MKPVKHIKALAFAAANAILHDTNITLFLPAGEKWPPGFPRGELLSIVPTGRNVSFDPIKVLAHIQRVIKQARRVKQPKEIS